jgi:hypothetical protein
MATSVLKKITAEAKLLRKQNPKLKWTSAIKKASEFYKGTVKPVAKKTYKKAKAVAKAGAKGVAVARRSYAKSMADIGRVQLKKSNYHPRDERYIILVNGKPHLNGEPFFKETAVQIAEALRKVHKKRKSKETSTKSKVGAVKKIAFKRTGKGGSKLGSVKKVGKPQIKPIKPTFAILNKQNPAFLSSLVDHSTKPKSKILVYSPLLNKYIIVVKYVDMYTVYIVSPAQTIRYSELFRVVGTHKATLDRINKKYDIDLIP